MNPMKQVPPLTGHVLGLPDSGFVVAEWQDPEGHTDSPRLIAPPHLHHHDDEAWYVIEGSLCVQLGDEVFELHAGSGIRVPPGTPHTYWNPGPGRVRYLLVMTSTIYRLIQEIHAVQDRSASSLQVVFRKYDSELLAN